LAKSNRKHAEKKRDDTPAGINGEISVGLGCGTTSSFKMNLDIKANVSYRPNKEELFTQTYKSKSPPELNKKQVKNDLNHSINSLEERKDDNEFDSIVEIEEVRRNS
jgi:hypothetical protein